MQDTFTKGMHRWFALKEFQVEIPTKGINQNFGLEDWQRLLENLAPLSPAVWAVLRNLQKTKRLEELVTKIGKRGAAVGVAIPVVIKYLVDTGASAADLYEALKPYTSRADLFGFKISDTKAGSTFVKDLENKTFWNTVMVPVIYADALTPDSIIQRFDKFLQAADPLKRLGLRAKFVGNQASIYPLLVYFDGKKLEEDKELLWPHIFEEGDAESMKPKTHSDKASWTPGFKATLSAGVVDVSEKWVLSDIFDGDDLYSVLEWGTRRE